MNTRTIVALLILALLTVFVFMNLEEARIWLFGIRAEMPIALVVFVSGGLGVAAGYLLAFVRKPRATRETKSGC